MKNTDKTLRLAVVPTRRAAFRSPLASESREKIIAKVKQLEAKYDFTGLYIEGEASDGMVATYDDALAVAEKMRTEKPDALFVPFCNFGEEAAIARLAQDLDVPVLVWGPRDPAPNGLEWRPLDSQCGMFAATKVLQRYGVTFTYIENCELDAPVFEKDFAQFLAVAQVVKAFRGLRVLQVSTRPAPFLSVMVNEGELLSQFGIEIVPVESSMMLNAVDEKLKDEFAQQRKDLVKSLTDAGLGISDVEDKIDIIAGIILAIEDMAKANHCTAISSECWWLFAKAYGVATCFLLGELNDRGIPTACENDIHAAITAVIATAAARYSSPSFVADLTIRHPENDNAELLWHCGPFAKTLMKKDAKGYITNGGKGFYEIEHGEYTVLRFDDAGNGKYNLFAGVGKGVDGPVTNGNYLWFEVDDWIKWEKKFIYGPYIHHVVGIPGNVTPILQEACRYLGLTYDHPDKALF